MSKRKTTQYKQKLKNLRNFKGKNVMKIEEETIEDKINILKKQIKLCENDLRNPLLKENINIINKINVIKEQLKELEKKDVK